MKPLKYQLDPQVCQKAARYATRVAEEMSKRSELLSEEVPVVEIDREELIPHIGDLLGKGGFNSVYGLETVPPQLDPTKKYAVKFLSDDALYSNEDFCNGAADLYMESKYLRALSCTVISQDKSSAESRKQQESEQQRHYHPALIQLHAVSKAGPAGFAQPERANFFIVIDRLYDTLDSRIEVWRELEFRNGNVSDATRQFKATVALFLQRLMVGQDIASALAYLHSRKMIFRDLKPDNVGFDYQGRVKIYDFGLAKELDPKQKCDGGADLYKMSGGTGSRRFMAPEVALSKPYSLSADLYSFSILLWEILTLRKAFGWMKTEEHRTRVVNGEERLPLPGDLSMAEVREADNRFSSLHVLQDLAYPSWSPELEELLRRCWCLDPLQRPAAHEAYEGLRNEISRVYSKEYPRS